MTNEEAIKALRLERGIEINGNAVRVAEFLQGLGVALSALRPVSREQVEKLRGEWQVCFEDWREQIAGDQCSKCGFQHYGTSINHYHFCPACGSPITNEAVDMVMERLEQIKCKN